MNIEEYVRISEYIGFTSGGDDETDIIVGGVEITNIRRYVVNKKHYSEYLTIEDKPELLSLINHSRNDDAKLKEFLDTMKESGKNFSYLKFTPATKSIECFTTKNLKLVQTMLGNIEKFKYDVINALNVHIKLTRSIISGKPIGTHPNPDNTDEFTHRDAIFWSIVLYDRHKVEIVDGNLFTVFDKNDKTFSFMQYPHHEHVIGDSFAKPSGFYIIFVYRKGDNYFYCQTPTTKDVILLKTIRLMQSGKIPLY